MKKFNFLIGILLIVLWACLPQFVNIDVIFPLEVGIFFLGITLMTNSFLTWLDKKR